MEIKIFKNKVSAYDLIHFMRDLRVVSRGDGSYINISRDQAANEKVKAVTGLANLDALFLSEKEVENFFQNCMLFDTWVLGFEENVGSQVAYNWPFFKMHPECMHLGEKGEWILWKFI